MPVIRSDRVVFFDVDDTLIFWSDPLMDLPTISINGRTFWVHKKHVQKIRDYHLMNFKIFVWSNSGYEWAHLVCICLGVEDMVTAMCKPHRVFDDAKTLGDTIGHGWMKPV